MTTNSDNRLKRSKIIKANRTRILKGLNSDRHSGFKVVQSGSSRRQTIFNMLKIQFLLINLHLVGFFLIYIQFNGHGSLQRVYNVCFFHHLLVQLVDFVVCVCNHVSSYLRERFLLVSEDGAVLEGDLRVTA